MQGGYLKDIQEAVWASLSSRQHLIVVGAPGWGKSAFLRSAARRTFRKALFLSVDPSTPPSRVRGRPHAGKLLQGVEEPYLEGTLLDPELEGAVVDEIFRGSEAFFDALLPVLERNRPLVFATANWVAEDERVEALRDRIGLWVHLSPFLDEETVRSVTGLALREGEDLVALLSAHHEVEVPPRELLEAVWRKPASREEEEEVVGRLTGLVEILEKEGFVLSPRRVRSMALVLYRTSLLYGDGEWRGVRQEAVRALRFCYPTVDAEEARRFATALRRTEDPRLVWIEDRLVEYAGELRRRRGRPEEIGAVLARLKNLLEEAGKVGLDREAQARFMQKAAQLAQVAARGQDPVRALPKPEEILRG